MTRSRMNAGVARHLGVGLLSNLPDVIARCQGALSQSSLHAPPEVYASAPMAKGGQASIADRVLSSLPVRRENSGADAVLSGLVAVTSGELGVKVRARVLPTVTRCPPLTPYSSLVKVCKNDEERRSDLRRKV